MLAQHSQYRELAFLCSATALGCLSLTLMFFKGAQPEAQ